LIKAATLHSKALSSARAKHDVLNRIITGSRYNVPAAGAYGLLDANEGTCQQQAFTFENLIEFAVKEYRTRAGNEYS
jgi:hypothetical protein